MLDRYTCPQPPDHSIVQLRVATYGKQVAPIRGLESTASHIYFLCCASLLFEALECFLLRSWLSRLLRHPARRAEWAYSYPLPGPTRGCSGDETSFCVSGPRHYSNTRTLLWRRDFTLCFRAKTHVCRLQDYLKRTVLISWLRTLIFIHSLLGKLLPAIPVFLWDLTGK